MPGEEVVARFTQARRACAEQEPLQCIVLSASMDMNEGEGRSLARLTVALPADQVAPFEAAVLAPLPDGSADVSVVSRSEEAENVTQQLSDSDRRLAQLTDYRDRLDAMRPDVRIAELIQIESERAKVQSETEQLNARGRDVRARSDLEHVSLSFVQEGSLFSPIAMAAIDSLELFARSTAEALRFLIQNHPMAADCHRRTVSADYHLAARARDQSATSRLASLR
jgi:hypothetical protein